MNVFDVCKLPTKQNGVSATMDNANEIAKKPCVSFGFRFTGTDTEREVR